MNYLPPFPPPLAWRVAYKGGPQFYHCPSWSRFGPVRPNGKWHKGIDIAAPSGMPVLAAVDGSLSYARDPGGWGLYAQVTFRPKRVAPDGTCGLGEPMRFVYAHLQDDDPHVVVGKETSIRAGEVIGRVGCSGNAKGMCSPSPESHVHITLRHAGGDREKIDPLPVVGWTLFAPPAETFQPTLSPCPIP